MKLRACLTSLLLAASTTMAVEIDAETFLKSLDGAKVL